MVNRVAKGRRIEVLAIRVLEAEGYLVHRCVRHIVHGKARTFQGSANDFFGCIDVIGKKAGRRTRWVQVTGASSIADKRRLMATVPWNPDVDQVEVWQYKARRGFRVFRLEDGFTSATPWLGDAAGPRINDGGPPGMRKSDGCIQAGAPGVVAVAAVVQDPQGRRDTSADLG